MRLLVFVAIFITFFKDYSLSQDIPLLFMRYTINEGLSNNSVNSVLQTSDGYLWIATKDGLNQFDGQAFKIFKHNLQDTTSLPENYVMSLLEDQDKAFWVGTWGGGLCKFDPAQETFLRFDSPIEDDDYIQALYEDHQGYIWYGTTVGGLFRLNKKTGQLKPFRGILDAKSTLSTKNITSITQDNQDILWLGTADAGLISFDPATESVQQFFHNPINENSLSDNYIWNVYYDNEDGLYVSTSAGLDIFDFQTRMFIHFADIPLTQKSYLSTAIRQTFKDKQGRIWIGAYDYQGLFCLEQENDKPTKLKHFLREDDNPNSLICDRIRCIYQDQRNNIWIGTEDGLNKLPYSQPFRQYRYLPQRDTKLGGRVVSSIYEGMNNILWVGYGGGGFDKIDLNTNAIKHHRVDPSHPEKLNNNDIITIYEDLKGILWIGTNAGGLNRFDPETGKYKHYKSNSAKPGYIQSNWVQQILETNSGHFLVGTNASLEIFDRQQETFLPYTSFLNVDEKALPDNIQTNVLFEDSAGNLWIGTWLDGLYCYKPSQKKFYHYIPDPANPNSISSSKITVVFEDSKGFIWIGTHSGGLNKFDKTGDTFIKYTIRNGLPNDVVFGIQEDAAGNLWLSTMKGLAKFDPETGSFRVYDEADGLIHNQFNWRASYKNKKGIMYFGGINGFISFQPDSIRVDTVPPPVAINSFKVFDKEILLNYSSDSASEIILPYDQNFFTIEFTTLDIAPKHKHRYAYMLEGVDPNWVNSNTETKASYTDIRAGSYVFKIKASNADHIWSEPLLLSIIVLPPWWLTLWFKIIMAVLFLVLVYGIYKYRIRQILEIYRIRLNIAGDLHDEIGSSLSSISVETHMLLNNTSLQESERTRLFEIADTIRDTIDAMRDIVWFIHPGTKSAEEIALKMRETASRLLDGLEWKIDVQPGFQLDSYKLEVRRNIFLILKEALTNVARHAAATKCLIKITSNSKYTQFNIMDNGVGFDTTNTKGGGIGVLNMKRRAVLIGAQFELRSIKNEGTEIELIIPLKTKILSSAIRQQKTETPHYPKSNSNFINKITGLLKGR